MAEKRVSNISGRGFVLVLLLLLLLLRTLYSLETSSARARARASYTVEEVRSVLAETSLKHYEVEKLMMGFVVTGVKDDLFIHNNPETSSLEE